MAAPRVVMRPFLLRLLLLSIALCQPLLASSELSSPATPPPAPGAPDGPACGLRNYTAHLNATDGWGRGRAACGNSTDSHVSTTVWCA